MIIKGCDNTPMINIYVKDDIYFLLKQEKNRSQLLDMLLRRYYCVDKPYDERIAKLKQKTINKGQNNKDV